MAAQNQVWRTLPLPCSWGLVKVGVGLSFAVRCLKKVGRGKEGKGCFGKSMNVWDVVVVHLKRNTSSIKQTWRTGPIHQRAAWISYWVQLRRDKCRTSSVCPRLPIDRDHHCDVAFYLTTCSLKPYIKPYIILFPTQKSHRRWGGWEGREPDCIFYSHNVWVSFLQAAVHGFWWSPWKFWGSLLGFVTAAAVCFILGLFPSRWISLRLTCRCALSDWLLSAQAGSPSAALIQMCQIRLRGKPPGLLLIRAIMEFHANKLSWLTVTVQWLGSTSATWPRRASSLSEAIMRKWSFAIELCNDKYWLISALIVWFNCVIGVWAYRVASNCSVVMCIIIESFDFFFNPLPSPQPATSDV